MACVCVLVGVWDLLLWAWDVCILLGIGVWFVELGIVCCDREMASSLLSWGCFYLDNVDYNYEYSRRQTNYSVACSS